MPTEVLYTTQQQGTGFSPEKRLVLFPVNKDVSLFRLTNTWRCSPNFKYLTFRHNNTLSHTIGHVRSLNLTNPLKIPSECNEPTQKAAANNYITSALCLVQGHNTPLRYQLVHMTKEDALAGWWLNEHTHSDTADHSTDVRTGEPRHDPATDVNHRYVNRTFNRHLSRYTALYYWPVALPATILQLSLTEWRTWLGTDRQRNKHNTINSNVLDVNSWYHPGGGFRFQNCCRNPAHVAFINAAE